MAQTAKPVQLQPRTVEGFDAYIRQAELQMEQTLKEGGPFLWSDLSPEQTELLRRGHVVAQSGRTEGR